MLSDKKINKIHLEMNENCFENILQARMDSCMYAL